MLGCPMGVGVIVPALSTPAAGWGSPLARTRFLQVPVSFQALCAAVAAPGLLKTILQFFSSSEAGLAADPAAYEMAPGADPLWDLESKRPRNHSGNSSTFRL